MSVPRPPRPTFNAMLICDNTIREEVTGKVSLVAFAPGRPDDANNQAQQETGFL